MNHVFKVLWSKSLGKWIVTSELGRGAKKTKRTQVATVLSGMLMGLMSVSGATTPELESKDFIQDSKLISLDGFDKKYNITSKLDVGDELERLGGFKTGDEWKFKIGSLNILGQSSQNGEAIGLIYRNKLGNKPISKKINVGIEALTLNTGGGNRLEFQVTGEESDGGQVYIKNIQSVISDSYQTVNKDKKGVIPVGSTIYLGALDSIKIDNYAGVDNRQDKDKLKEKIYGNRISIYNTRDVQIGHFSSINIGKSTGYLGLHGVDNAEIAELTLDNNYLHITDGDSGSTILQVGKLSVTGGMITVGSAEVGSGGNSTDQQSNGIENISVDKSQLIVSGGGNITAHNYGDYAVAHKRGDGDDIESNQYHINHLTVAGGEMILDRADVKDAEFKFGRLDIENGASLSLKGNNENQFQLNKRDLNEEATGKTAEISNSGIVFGGAALIDHNFVNETTGKLYVGDAFNQPENTLDDLTITNYEGVKGSELHFGAGLKSNGEYEHLVITETAKGTSGVVVHQVAETKEAITNGVVLAKFKGEESDNTLKLHLQRPVTDGLYNYGLSERSSDSKGSEWILTNNLQDGSNAANNKDYATQSSAYLATMAVSNEMFNHRYHDRLYSPGDNGVWTHVNSSFGKFKSSLSDDISSKTNRVTMYLGKDLVSRNEYAMGVMAAYGYASGKSENKNHRSTAVKTDYRSHGFAVGVYGTYTFAPNSYIDAWAQYVHSRNKLEWGGNSEKYNAKGVVLSLEAAHAFSLADSIYFQPQAQITYMGVKADDLTVGHYRYSSDRGNVQFRLGGRFFGEGIFANGAGTPYLEANYIHNTKGQKVHARNSIESLELKVDGAKNLFQVKVGSDYNLNTNTKIGAQISHTFGKNSYRDTQINVDFRYNF